ncbi:Hpt domain-containing protein [Phenylobacterium sp. J426]|uniref:Hpt domain-containing protein n=1 Tax=Phenylobacterium sp. J426 TaxID=2898439 RepID=UPI002151626F|nr:Hpt domain-containing protein [Phenylobacterium sp. J426]MCR5872905.1 Hpt domain-containing protein [Phenylobacterium sp. J426]
MTQTDRPDPLAALRARFLARAADDLAWIRATGGAPQDELLARAHKLAGSGGVFGYGGVSAAAAALEDELREGRPADMTALISALEALPPG